jgi:DNA-binding transcriptional ArsR family regulator
MVEVGASEAAKLRYIMAHPMRAKIIQTLIKAGKAMYIAQIADEIGVDRKLVSYHLLTLLQHGIVSGRYALRGGPPRDEEGRPIIVRYYELTPKAKSIIERT